MSTTLMKPKKTDAARVRMDPSLKQRLEQLAMIQSLDLSDVNPHRLVAGFNDVEERHIS